MVAVKMFNAMASHVRPSHKREFDVLKKLNHDNIVRLLAIEEEVRMHDSSVPAPQTAASFMCVCHRVAKLKLQQIKFKRKTALPDHRRLQFEPT